MAANRQINVGVGISVQGQQGINQLRRLNRQMVKQSKQIDRLRRAQSRLNKVARRFTSLLSPMVAGLAGAAVGVHQLVQSVLELDTALTKVEFLVGVTGAQLDGLSKGMVSISQRTGRGLVELGQGLFDVTSAGFRGAQAIDVLGSSADAAVLGLGNTAEAANALTSAIGAWGASNLTANKAVSVLWAGVRQGKATGDAFINMISRMGAVSAQLQVEMEQVTGAYAFLTRSMSSQDALTALQGAVKVFIKPSQQAIKALKKYGLTVRDVKKLVSEDLTQAIITLYRTMDQGDFSKLFRDTRGLTAALTIGRNADQATRIAGNVTATTIQEFNQAVQGAGKSFSNQLNQVTAGMRGSFTELGTEIMPAVITVVGFFSDKIENATDALTSFIQAVSEDTEPDQFQTAHAEKLRQGIGDGELDVHFNNGTWNMRTLSVIPSEQNTMAMRRFRAADETGQARTRHEQRILAQAPEHEMRAVAQQAAKEAEELANKIAKQWQGIAHDVASAQASYVQTLQGQGQARIMERQRIAREQETQQRLARQRSFALSSGAFQGQDFMTDLERSMRAQVESNDQRQRGLDLTERQIFLRENINAIDDQIYDARKQIARLSHDMKFQDTDQQIVSQNQIDSLEKYIEKLQQGKVSVRQFAMEITNSVESEIVPSWARLATQQERFDSVMDASRGHMKGFFMEIVDGSMSASEAFKRMAARILESIWQIHVAEQAAGQLAGLIGGLFGAVGAVGPYNTSFAATGGAAIPTLQYGGNALAGRAHIVGERGPELFVPHTSGFMQKEVGGEVTQVFNYNISSVDGSGVRAALSEQVPKIAARARQEMTQQLTRPGPLRRAVTGR